ncbi:metal ABC transporter solute-binding protein, Zn/Mn family [Desulfococcus multivorans]|uniref:ABC-type metal ion transporter, periplasmic subunit n=2 Tax=Desulfococcus TaxID=896 RepID=S7V4V2_DESML|nr:zinc ABC transporter substrate-binding protein [Desulfococcus multivorans]AQV02504.1 manganese transporter [Desulfococcus multivorans]EPR41659.1 ABC-type metal ion transporter, periplasmic subunit [Desulfococcus multivorans DSM 2059]SJZ60731.1 manganese/zinc/iron transport system substrate-binding protein [Desulfococcus multivorans DSM 2059]
MPPTHPSRYRTAVALLTLAFLAVGAFCPPSAGAYDGKYPFRAGATVGMVADIVREVAGDRAEVTDIIGAGVDPHLYNPTRGDVAVLLRSDIVFYSGLLLEGQMTEILAKVGRRRPVIPVTERLERTDLIHTPQTRHYDPHVWMDVQGWMKAVAVVRDALSAFDPQNAPEYGARAEAYLSNLKTLDDYVRKVIASIPENQRVMITAHDAFSYFGRAYDIEVMGIQGLSTESEAGLKDINRIVDELVRRRIPAVFVETSVSDKNVKALIEGARSRGHSVRIGGTLFSDAMGKAGTYEGTYIGMIDHNATVIARALGGDAPQTGMQGKLTSLY